MFKGKLRSVKKKTVFAESTYNDTWGTGLDKQGTENTKMEAWPEKNYLDRLLVKSAKKSETQEKQSVSKPNQKQYTQINIKQ